MYKTLIMSHIHLFVAFCATLLPNIQSLTYEDVNFLDRQVYFENSANDLFTNRLNGTRFCESILLPSQQTYIKALHAALTDKYFTGNGKENDLIDSCCRSVHECEAYTGNEFDHKNIRHCDCINLFRKCLKSINSTKSDELAFIYSINATKCYAKAFPIIECSEFEAFTNSERQFDNPINVAERNKFFNRCIRFKFDRKQLQKVQLFDLPLGDYGMATVTATLANETEDEIREKFLMIAKKILSKILSNACKVVPYYCEDSEANNSKEKLPQTQHFTFNQAFNINSDKTIINNRAGKVIASDAAFTIMAAMTAIPAIFNDVQDVRLTNSERTWWELAIIPKMQSGKRQIVLVDIKFPDNFPIDAPIIRFKTRIQHPSIDEYGIAKLSIIKAENWTPNVKIRDVIGSLVKLINSQRVEQADFKEQ